MRQIDWHDLFYTDGKERPTEHIEAIHIIGDGERRERPHPKKSLREQARAELSHVRGVGYVVKLSSRLPALAATYFLILEKRKSAAATAAARAAFQADAEKLLISYVAAKGYDPGVAVRYDMPELIFPPLRARGYIAE